MKHWRNYSIGLLALFLLSGCALGISEIPLDELKKKYAQSPSQYINVDGLQVHYRDEGAGEPIVLLHGILTSLHTWDEWSRELKKNYRVITLDLPAFGLTGDANFAYNEETYLHFLERFFEEKRLSRFVLVGNSLGGWFAWNYAIKHPSQISSLVLIDSAGFPAKPPPPVWAFTSPWTSWIATRFTPRIASKILLKQVYAKPERITDTLIDHYYEMQLRPGNRKAAQKLFDFALPYLKKEPVGLEKLTMPTLLMWGEQDRWFPMSHFARWRQAVPHAQSVTYSDAGHMAMEEIPAKSVKDLKRFLAGEPVR